MQLLAKQKISQSCVFKIRTTRLKKAGFSLSLKVEQARKNKELVKLSSSQALRFINSIRDKEKEKELNDTYDREEEIRKIKEEINRLRKEKVCVENRKKITKQYDLLNSIQFVKDYIPIVMDNNKDFDRLNTKEGFDINGTKYKRLVATTGGGKNSTVIYTSAEMYDELDKRLNNGRNIKKKIIPAKLEAYKALAFSSSVPVSHPEGVLVVKDVFTTFKDNIILVDDTKSKDTNIEPDVDYIEDHEIKDMNASDGFGLMLPSRSKTWGEELEEKSEHPSFTIRNSFCKGVLHPFDFLDYADKFADGNYMVEDAWGDLVDIRKCDVILTTSMLKLWDSYDDIAHYLRCCEENGYTFSVTKSTPNKLDHQRHLNYQFIQSLQLTDSDIDELIKPTVDDVFDILGGDYKKSLLYLRGIDLKKINFKRENNDFAQALMIDKNMINDPFIKSHIHKMLKKQIDEAKMGVLKVGGNFSIVSGDPYTLIQSVFKKPLTGLLNAGEYYSQYWLDKNVTEVAAFRAPMTCMNNVRKLKFKDSEKTRYWYKYMNTVTIMNSWDTTTHAMNGEDFDGDTNFTTDSNILLSSIEYRDAILCVQKTVDKVIPTESLLIRANKDSFGDAIGTITNRITSMFDVLANFEEGSEEYKEVMYRIICGQNYQQNAIDKSKGVKSKSMPKKWYDRKANMPPILLDDKKKPIKDENGRFILLPETEEEKNKREFNLRIVADKKPYFFIWNDPSEFKKYRTYVKNAERNCSIRYGKTIDELMNKESKSSEEIEFLKWFHTTMPVSKSNSVMNRICNKVEYAFKDIPDKVKESEFDYSVLKTDKEYSKTRFKQIFELYKRHNKELRDYMTNLQTEYQNDEDREKAEEIRTVFFEGFKREADKICNNEEDLCNMVIDICYEKSDKSKQFAWDVAGQQIIRNLLAKNNYTYAFPKRDENGDIEYLGEKFIMETKTIKKDDCY